MIIYKTTNLINNKIYIGQDSRNLENYYGSGVVITNALKKYGKENFSKATLEICDTQEELNERERYWIKQYNSTNRDIGYNITEGGGGILGYTHKPETIQKMKDSHHDVSGKNNPMYGKTFSEDHKKKISESKKGKSISEEHKKKISKAFKDIPLKDEHKQKISKALTGRKLSESTKEKLRGERLASKGGNNGRARKINVNGIVYGCIRDYMKVSGKSQYFVDIRLKSKSFPEYKYL